MDMVLYSMFKNKIANTPSNQVDNVGGCEIRFVEDLPNIRESKTLYIVLGDYKDGDKINVGGRGIEKIVFENTIIDYGILNGNVFLNKFDYNRGITRKYMISNNGNYIVLNGTVNVPILDFTITGQDNISYVNSVTVSNTKILINKYFSGLDKGADCLDLTTGVFTKAMEACVIDSTLEWRYVADYGNYIGLKCTGYSKNKPIFLTSNGLYNQTECMDINSNNAFTVNTNFIVGFTNSNECIYVNNGSLLVRVSKDHISNANSTYGVSFSNYLKENPFVVAVKRVNPTQETILSVAQAQPIMASEGLTMISIDCKDEAKPILEVKLPIKE